MLRLEKLLSVFGLCLLTACSTAKGPNLRKIASEINATRVASASVISPGDLLSIQFRQDDQYNQEVAVNGDGTVSLLELGSRRVAGLTLDKLSDMMGEEHVGLTDSVPTVSIVESAPRTVTVLGEVFTPGSVPIGPDQRLTLTEAIGQAGNFRKATAWMSSTLLVRWDPVEQEQRAWKIDARPRHWGGAEPVFLQPYDVVFIPNTNVDRVAIWVDNFIRRMLPLPFLPGV